MSLLREGRNFRILLTRKYSIPALHTLSGLGFSESRNLEVFGACSRLHGHEYRVEVTVSGKIAGRSGLLVSRDSLDSTVEAELGCLRGANLSDRFRHTTGEGLAVEFLGLLQDRMPPGLKLERITVHETAKNSFVANATRHHTRPQP